MLVLCSIDDRTSVSTRTGSLNHQHHHSIYWNLPNLEQASPLVGDLPVPLVGYTMRRISGEVSQRFRSRGWTSKLTHSRSPSDSLVFLDDDCHLHTLYERLWQCHAKNQPCQLPSFDGGEKWFVVTAQRTNSFVVFSVGDSEESPKALYFERLDPSHGLDEKCARHTSQ